jgi:tripartite-type tricarboxylate transporter receptor subunit TctC
MTVAFKSFKPFNTFKLVARESLKAIGREVKMKRRRITLKIKAALLLLPIIGLAPALVHSDDNFYAGKTVTLVATTAPGGTGDLRVRAMQPFFQKYIPGNPTVVIEYISGGGGRKGANHLYNNVEPDGLTIGAMSGGVVGLAVTGELGVKYDPAKFIYLGTPHHINHTVIYTRADLGLDTLEKLRAHPGLRIGGQTVGHVSYTGGRLLAYFLDLKDPKFIVGYSSREVDVALMRGELDARANSPTSALRRNPEWLEKGIMHWHAILEAPKGKKFPRLEHLPEIGSFAKKASEKNLLSLWRALRGVGSPYVLPPGSPKEIVQTLRGTVDKIFADPEFPAYYEKLVAEEASPLNGDELTKLVAEMPQDRETLGLLKKFSGAGPLPKR